MIKKIWLFVLSFIAIGLFWVSFADLIEPNTHYVNRCVKFQNVEIDNYRVIVDIDTVIGDWEVYEPQAGECLRHHYQFWESRQYLLDKSVNLDEITQENIQDNAIQIWNLKVIWHYVDDLNPLSNEIITYKIIKNWDDYALEESDNKSAEISWNENNYSLEIVESKQGIAIPESRLIKFWIAWIMTILIETIILFIIAKLFRKEDQISNKRLILIWILASTITLPLLRFVLPLFVTDGTIYMIVWELAVTLIEIFIIKYWLKISRGKAILASVICNLCSFLFWLLVF